MSSPFMSSDLRPMDVWRAESPEEVTKTLHVPLGVVSPLWLMFAGAAGAGVAYWWMTRWTRPANLEAWLGASAPLSLEVAPEPAPEAEQAPPVSLAVVPPPTVVESDIAPPPAEPEPAPFVEAASFLALEPEPVADLQSEALPPEPEPATPRAKAGKSKAPPADA